MNKWFWAGIGLILVLIVVRTESVIKAQFAENINQMHAWTATRIGPLPWGYHVHYPTTGIDLDRNSRAHISYSLGEDGLGYATNSQGCWSTSTLYSLSPISIARENSIAVDANDHVHVSSSYSDGDDEDLIYATNSSGTWAITTVDDRLSVGLENAIAVDHDGHPHISHWMWNDNRLKYSTNRTDVWVTELLGEATWDRTAIVVDSRDHVYIAYSRAGSLIVTTNATGSWIDTTIAYGASPSLTIDSHDKLHMSFDGSGHLKYANNASGQWTTTTVTANVASGRNHAVALDNQDHAHISYYDDVRADLMYAYNASGVWTTTTIDSQGDVGRSNAIAVDQNGKVHISYRDDGVTLAPSISASLKYVTNAIQPACNHGYLPLIRQP